jgi:hypothetical protein
MVADKPSYSGDRVAAWMQAVLMEPKPDWNCQGPRLPAWFRKALKKVNPKLCMQFIPPRRMFEDRGTNPERYPHGVWTICRKPFRTSRLMFKRWTWNLSDSFGRYQPPGRDTITFLRLAEKLHRSNDGDVLEDEFMRTLDELNTARTEKSREELAKLVADLCRKHNMRVGTSHVWMRDSIMAD